MDNKNVGRIRLFLFLVIIVSIFGSVSNIDFKEKMASEKEQANKTPKYDAKAQMIRACEKIAGN